MSVLTLNVDEVMRTLSAESSNPFVVHDKEVDIVRFAINSGFADIVLDGQVALRVMYQRPGESEVRAQTLTYYDTDGLHNYYDWQLSQSDLAKDGSLMVALCILDISGGEVSEWHTTPCAVRVLSTIHTDDSDEGDDTITPTVKERVAVLETMIQRVASGAPIVVTSTSAMTDTDQIYVLSTNGRWYYHNGSAWVSGGTYGAVATDTTLTQTGAAADAAETGRQIDGLKADLGDVKTVFDEYNVLAEIIDRQTNVNWLSGTGLGTTTGSWDIIKCKIVPGLKYWFVKPEPTLFANGIRFADASNAYLGYVSDYNALVVIPDSTEYVYVKCPIGSTPIAIAESNYEAYASGYKRKLVETYVKDAADALNIADTLTDVVNSVLEPSVNLADPAEFVKGKYMLSTGAVGNSSGYFYTGKISVAEGDVIYSTPSPRYYTAFNGENVVVTDITFPWTVPSGINGLIVTVSMSAVGNLMITKNRLLPYIPYSPQIDNNYLNIENQNAINGNDGITAETENLEALTTFEITAYPKGIATHDRLSGYCEFSELGEIEFGYGYTSNYFVKIDASNIYRYYKGSVVGDPIPHGLTITDYIMFSLIMGDDRTANVTINTTGGNISFTFSLNYSKNGLPFIRSTTALSNVKLSALSADIRKSIWWFGDSYSSNASERVIGQLNQLGVIGNMLINAVPGMRSYYDANTGGYVDFIKLINMAKPKYVIWSYGMNDTEANYKGFLLRVKNICDVYNIELYAVKVPSVPNIDNSGKNAYIDELGIKSIDWAKAVGATSVGVWREGYLSNDNVHPTVKGAQAMAARTLVDCPAIMQF